MRRRRAFLSRFVLLTLVVVALTMLRILITPWLIETFFLEFKNVTGKVQLTIWLTRLMWPYLALVSVALIQAILNTGRSSPPRRSRRAPGCVDHRLWHRPRRLHAEPAHALVAGFLLGSLFKSSFRSPS